MVKNMQLKRSELIDLLHSAQNSKQRNRAVKLLKKFEPGPHRELDAEADAKNMKPVQYELLQAFVCFRCDKVKQTHLKVHWSTTKGVKILCHACYLNLVECSSIEANRRLVNKYAYGK